MGTELKKISMNWFISFLKKVKYYFIHFNNCMKEDHCSWCGKYHTDLTRIWYTESADDVCDNCLNPPQSIKFIRSKL